MPKSATFSALVDSATKCLATAVRRRRSPASSQSRAEVALVIVSMVVKVLEATMNSVSAGSRSRTASCRSAPSTFDTNRTVSVAVGERAQRLVRHRRAEVGAADADVDDVPDPLAGVAGPLARTDPVGEGGHLVQHGVHGRDHVLAVHLDHRVARRAQRGVQHGAVLGDVDLLAAEHGVPQPGHAGRRRRAPAAARASRRSPGAWSSRCAGRRPAGCSPAAAPGIGGEQLPQVRLPQLLAVLAECHPLGRLVEPAYGCLRSSRTSTRFFRPVVPRRSPT